MSVEASIDLAARSLERIAEAIERLSSAPPTDSECGNVADGLINYLMARCREEKFADPWNFLTTRGREVAAHRLKELLTRER